MFIQMIQMQKDINYQGLNL